MFCYYLYYEYHLEKGCFTSEFILDHQQVNLFIVSKGSIFILSYVTFPFGIKDECMIRPEAFSTPNRWLVNRSWQKLICFKLLQHYYIYIDINIYIWYCICAETMYGACSHFPCVLLLYSFEASKMILVQPICLEILATGLDIIWVYLLHRSKDVLFPLDISPEIVTQTYFEISLLFLNRKETDPFLSRCTSVSRLPLPSTRN